MPATEVFIKGLQKATDNESFPKKFWENYPENDTHTFQDALDKYTEYYGSLKTTQQKEALSKIFWEQIQVIGTPIIENRLGEDNCDVYFLFPKNEISDSTEKRGSKKDLYLQGDFHGIGSTVGKQRLLERSDTGIMWRKNRMPKEGLVVYSYIQVEPSHRNIKPIPERSPFFNVGEGFTPNSTETNFPEIPSDVAIDKNSTHSSPYPGFNSPQRIFRVSADSEHAHIQSKPIDWPTLLSTQTPSHSRNFVYHATLYSDQAGDLHRSEAKVTKQYHDDLYYSDQANSPYANFTRAIQVFKPATGKIDDVIVVNDGTPYLITGILDHFEKMANEKKLSPNTVFVFINTLPGLKTTLSKETAEAFNKDPSVKLPGMGVRLIDYKHGIDQYIDFIGNKLFPHLKNEKISVPDDPKHRVMIGSSLSGTASIYISLKRPDLFGAVIAQSPSPDNRAILSKIPKEMLTKRNINLSCGEFEHPDYAGANANIEYATELVKKLDIPLQQGSYGHQFIPWNEELERSLPKLALQKIIEPAHVPAVGYAYVEAKEKSFASDSFTFGKKNAQTTGAVDDHTRFPASSLSKIVFTYLVLQLVKKGEIDLDKPLHDILQYERFKVDGEYPDKAKQLTARHILSHTTGLPNVRGDLSSPLKFDPNSKLGEKYSYSGEAFLYLQKVIEKKMGKDLEALAEEYVFKPLKMERSTFLPQRENDTNVVTLHTELGKATSIYDSLPHLKYDLKLMSSLSDLSQAEKNKIYLSENPREYYVKGMSKPASIPQKIDLTNLATKLNKPSFRSDILAITSKAGHTPHLNAAGSLLTTADDFSKFMTAWLEDTDPIMQQAFEPTNVSGFKKCGLGWHIYKNKDEVIAYQYGENRNTRAFVAINLTTKKGAAFFTNAEQGMSIANQLLNSSDFVPIGNLQEVYKALSYIQSDEPGWKETIAGKIAEDQGKFEEAKDYFKKALKLAFNDKSKYFRLKWFNEVHQPTQEKHTFNQPLKSFVGEYNNPHEKVEISIRGGDLIYKQFGRETKLVRVSETDFLPEKDQSFKIRINNDQMSKLEIQGYKKSLSKQPSAKSQEKSQLTSSAVMIAKKLDIKHASPPLKDDDKKVTKDDIAVQATKEKRAAQKFANKTEKKDDVTSTDDFNITYDKRPGK